MIETDDKGNVIGYKNISMFPDDVETITMTRQDYDRHMENLIYENVELKQRIDKAIDYIRNNSYKFLYYEETDEGQIDLSKCKYRITPLRATKVKQLLDILKGSGKNGN